MKSIIDIITEGKKSKGDLKIQTYINWFVIFGFLLFIYWLTFLYSKTFVSISLVLTLLFIPSLIITLFCFKKLVQICGYVYPLKNNIKYNLLMSVLSYFLIMIPIGNIIVSIFLSVNLFFAQKQEFSIFVKPSDFWEASTSRSFSRYSKMEIDAFGISKNISLGRTDINSVLSKVLILTYSKGFFGYNIIRGHHFQDGAWLQ